MRVVMVLEPDTHMDGTLNVVPDASERSFDTALREEMEYLLASETFRKSPKLSQLLAYLVGATLRGEGEALKSYTVAVEGLGRDPDFDAQADSYPRVQVMRLRNFLGSFYARYEPRNEMCIYILPGSYRVRLAKFSIAYPDIVVRDARRRLAPSFQHADGSAAVAPRSVPPTYPEDNVIPVAREASNAAPSTSAETSGSGRGLWLLLLAVLVGIAATAVLLYVTMWKPELAGRARDEAPTLLVAKVEAPSDSQSIDLAMEIRHAMIDGFSRSWAFNTLEVHGDHHEEAVMGSYTVSAALSQNRNNSRTLQILVTDETEELTIWSRNFPIDETKDVRDQLALALSKMTGPLGVIGRREFEKAEGRKLDDYSCLLGAFRTLSGKTFPQSDEVQQCISEPLKQRRLEAVRLSVLALKTITSSSQSERRQALIKGENLAQQAIETDPSEATGYYAMALLKYVQQQCEVGNSYAARTLQLNGYGQGILMGLASYVEDCGYTDAERFIEKAFATIEPGDSTLRLSVVTLALRHDRKDILVSIGAAPSGAAGETDPAVQLSEALIAAYFNDIPASKRHWAAYVALRKMRGATPDELLQGTINSINTRKLVIELLQDRGVIA